MKRVKLRQEWENRIAEYHSSGMSASEWCAANNQSIYKLRYWIKNINKIEETVPSSKRWMSVTLEASQEETVSLPSTLTIKVADVVIEVPSDFDPSLLQNVIRTLRTL